MTIKRRPDDFRVEERLTGAFLARVSPAPGPFALYRLVKESLDTPAALGLLARAAHAAPSDVAAAGLKDRHAHTEQYVTLRAPTGDRGATPDLLEGPGWRARRVGWAPTPMTPAAIEANRFRVVLRDLSPAECRAMDEAARFLSPAVAGADRALLFTNSFGDQRFGSARHGKGFAASLLIRGRFEEALRLVLAAPARQDRGPLKRARRAAAARWGRWSELRPLFRKTPYRRALERLAKNGEDFRLAFAALPAFDQQMIAEAYQSYLWNDAARRFIHSWAARTGAPLLRRPDRYGEMLFPHAAAAAPALATLAMPVLGYGSALKEPWAAAARESLSAEGIATTRDLRVPDLRLPAFRQAHRTMFVMARDFSLTPPEKDAETPGRFARTAEFSLPRGSYATVLLRALGQ
ncbi:MAG: tRNA pseudouridine(13) synthase TruD [Planctomycetes bacterium]|nr:tRNA pseudouridine(13) synthase TruD [Planctomycetota bacterium]